MKDNFDWFYLLDGCVPSFTVVTLVEIFTLILTISSTDLLSLPSEFSTQIIYITDFNVKITRHCTVHMSYL